MIGKKLKPNHAATAKGPFVNRRIRYLHRSRRPRYPNWAGITSLTTLALAIIYILWQ